MSVPTIAVAPFVLKDVQFEVAAHEYKKNVSQVEFQPSTSSVTWQGLSPDASFSDQSAPTWACAISYAQDWTTPDSFSQYLMAHAGEKVPATFKTNNGAGSFAATLILGPGPIGGTVNSVGVGTVTLGVDGAPVFTPVTPLAADRTDTDDTTDDDSDTDDADRVL
jgi:hypothetical protein